MLTRYQMYVQATGDTSWGKAPIWLNEQYFKFCEETHMEPHYMNTPAGTKMSLIQPEEQELFSNWLIKTYKLQDKKN